MVFSHQLVRGFLFLNCLSAQYLPYTQSNKIVFPALTAKNARQNHYGLTSGQIMCLFVFIFAGNLCFSCSPWIQEQLITAPWPALTFLMQNDLLCLQGPSGSSCTIPLPPGDLQISLRAPRRVHTQISSSPTWAHPAQGPFICPVCTDCFQSHLRYHRQRPRYIYKLWAW